MYLAVCTRPDIAYLISIVVQDLENPKQSSWTSVKGIFRYVKATVDHGLLYKSTGLELQEVYADSDW